MKFFLAHYEDPKTFELLERLVGAWDEKEAVAMVNTKGKLKCIRELSPLDLPGSQLSELL